MSEPDETHTLMPDLSVPFVAAVYAIIDGEGSIEDAADLLHQIERRTGFFVFTSEANIYKYAPDDTEHRMALWSFLDETRMVITGGEICNYVEMCDFQGRSYEFTWRHWGEELAKWANSRKLVLQRNPDHPSPDLTTGPWGYIDFYMDVYPGAEFEKYEEWARAVLEIIEFKSKKYPFEPDTN